MFKFTAKHTIFLLLLTLFCQISVAQFQLVPLRNTEISKKSSAKTTALALPFFDDFSTSVNQPSQQKWLKGGGVFINNNSTENQPTLNVATFDGLKNSGVPYNFNDSFANGATDSLTSVPINLKYPSVDALKADGVYLSFFYQSQGLGEVPDANDSLIVQFLTNGGKWETVFIAKDGKHIIGKDTTKLTNNDKFTQVIFPITSQVYMYDGFQFRFRTFGRQSGQFDVWHIDYVYLGRNDRIEEKDEKREYNPLTKTFFFRDLAFQNPVTSVLKNYNAMPLSQFNNNPKASLSENVSSSVFFLWKTFTNTTGAYSIQDLSSAKKDTLLKEGFEKINPQSLSSTSISRANLLTNPKILDILKSKEKITLKYNFTFVNSESSIFHANDTISRTTELDNFYAYDDGTAETGAYLKKGFGRVAIMFVNNKADVVKAIRINLQSVLDSTRLASTNLSLQVMANDKGKPGRILQGLSGKITYPKTNNGFIEYAIEPVAVADTFYVGYTQLSDDEALVVGLDNNSSQFAKNHFYNVANEWINVGKVSANSGFTPIKGSLMIRPVMGGVAKEAKPLATEEEIQDRNLVISPNPTMDIIRWNDASLKNAEILDMLGRSVLLEKSENQEINISNLNSGTYILRLTNDKNTFVRKIVKL